MDTIISGSTNDLGFVPNSGYVTASLSGRQFAIIKKEANEMGSMACCSTIMGKDNVIQSAVDTSAIIGKDNVIESNVETSTIMGTNNTIPTGSKQVIIIGNNIHLDEDSPKKNVIYLGGDAKVYIKIRDEFVDLVETLEMLLYAPPGEGGVLYRAAKKSFENAC